MDIDEAQQLVLAANAGEDVDQADLLRAMVYLEALRVQADRDLAGP